MIYTVDLHHLIVLLFTRFAQIWNWSMWCTDWINQISLFLSVGSKRLYFYKGTQGFHPNLRSSYLTMNSGFLWSLRLLLYRMALFLLKAWSPSWDISPLNQLWDLIDCTDFLVGLCALKKWSPSFNAPWIKQGRLVHSSLTRLHNDSTFVANKRLTRKEWSDGRINLLEASPQFSHHFSCRMSSWIVTQKAKLSMRDDFSAIQCSEKPERERVSEEVWDKLCLGVKWSVWLFVDQKWQLYLYLSYAATVNRMFHRLANRLFHLLSTGIHILYWEGTRVQSQLSLSSN